MSKKYFKNDSEKNFNISIFLNSTDKNISKSQKSTKDLFLKHQMPEVNQVNKVPLRYLNSPSRSTLGNAQKKSLKILPQTSLGSSLSTPLSTSTPLGSSLSTPLSTSTSLGSSLSTPLSTSTPLGSSLSTPLSTSTSLGSSLSTPLSSSTPLGNFPTDTIELGPKIEVQPDTHLQIDSQPHLNLKLNSSQPQAISLVPQVISLVLLATFFVSSLFLKKNSVTENQQDSEKKFVTLDLFSCGLLLFKGEQVFLIKDIPKLNFQKGTIGVIKEELEASMYQIEFPEQAKDREIITSFNLSKNYYDNFISSFLAL